MKKLNCVILLSLLSSSCMVLANNTPKVSDQPNFNFTIYNASSVPLTIQQVPNFFQSDLWCANGDDPNPGCFGPVTLKAKSSNFNPLVIFSTGEYYDAIITGFGVIIPMPQITLKVSDNQGNSCGLCLNYDGYQAGPQNITFNDPNPAINGCNYTPRGGQYNC